VAVPVIASGGMGKPADLIDVVRHGGADAVAMADILHYGRATVSDIRRTAQSADIDVRHHEST
jgi:cyclase